MEGACETNGDQGPPFLLFFPSFAITLGTWNWAAHFFSYL